MHKIDKTITVKGSGNIFIPRRIIKDEYPKPKTNEGQNNNTVLEGLFGLYAPDAYYYVQSVGEPGNSVNEKVFVENLTPQMIEQNRGKWFYCLYKDNNLNAAKCIYAIVGQNFGNAVSDTKYRPALYLDGVSFVESSFEGYYEVITS